jgi:hemolysin D
VDSAHRRIASIGSTVQAGQTTATIEPSDAPLIVEADLPAQDAGFLKIGQSTRIKVTAYPFEQYGSIPGKVVWISPTAESISTLVSLPAGDSHQPLTPPTQNPSMSGTEQTQASGPPVLYYRVKIVPARNWLNVQGQHQAMRAGMTASIDIETGQRRVLDFFLDPIIKYVQNGITVR